MSKVKREELVKAMMFGEAAVDIIDIDLELFKATIAAAVDMYATHNKIDRLALIREIKKIMEEKKIE